MKKILKNLLFNVKNKQTGKTSILKVIRCVVCWGFTAFALLWVGIIVSSVFRVLVLGYKPAPRPKEEVAAVEEVQQNVTEENTAVVEEDPQPEAEEVKEETKEAEAPAEEEKPQEQTAKTYDTSNYTPIEKVAVKVDSDLADIIDLKDFKEYKESLLAEFPDVHKAKGYDSFINASEDISKNYTRNYFSMPELSIIDYDGHFRSLKLDTHHSKTLIVYNSWANVCEGADIVKFDTPQATNKYYVYVDWYGHETYTKEFDNIYEAIEFLNEPLTE